MPNSLMVTDLAKFYRAFDGDETRFYPESAKKQALDFANDFPPVIQGFGVYDTTVATDYAVAVYPSKEEAEMHTAAEAPTAPETAFSAVDDAHASDCATHNAPAEEPGECDCKDEPSEPFATTADQERATAKPAPKSAAKRRGPFKRG